MWFLIHLCRCIFSERMVWPFRVRFKHCPPVCVCSPRMQLVSKRRGLGTVQGLCVAIQLEGGDLQAVCMIRRSIDYWSMLSATPEHMQQQY